MDDQLPVDRCFAIDFTSFLLWRGRSYSKEEFEFFFPKVTTIQAVDLPAHTLLQTMQDFK